jgi:AraC family transcriptional regulator
MTYVGTLDIRTQRGLQATSSVSRTWNGVTVCATDMHWSGDEGWHDATRELPGLSIVLEEIGGRYEHRVRLDQQLQARSAQSRSISLIPAGMHLWGYANRLRYARVARFGFDMPALRGALEERLALPAIDEPRLMFTDDRVWQIGTLLAAECANPSDDGTLYGESLVVALCVGLLRLGGQPEQDRKGSRLAPWQIRCLVEYMEAHLSDAIRLSELAALARLSLSHFSRAFRKSFGMPPHRWYMNVRIRRAQVLLLETSLPLTDVAAATGFADQSHLTRVFHRQVGIPPALWRRERQA